MTPKEKAHELYDKYYNLIDHQDNYWSVDDEAKQASLIAANEVLDALGYNCKYWLEVVQELESL